MILGSRRHGARFGTALANVGDLNMDGYEGRTYEHKRKIPSLMLLQQAPSCCGPDAKSLDSCAIRHLHELLIIFGSKMKITHTRHLHLDWN